MCAYRNTLRLFTTIAPHPIHNRVRQNKEVNSIILGKSVFLQTINATINFLTNYFNPYTCVCVCVSVSIEAYLIKYDRQPLSTYFFYFNPFKSQYGCYDIQLELADKFSVFNGFPSLLDPSLAIIKGCVYCKSKIQHFIYTGITFIYIYIYIYIYIKVCTRAHTHTKIILQKLF